MSFPFQRLASRLLSPAFHNHPFSPKTPVNSNHRILFEKLQKDSTLSSEIKTKATANSTAGCTNIVRKVQGICARCLTTAKKAFGWLAKMVRIIIRIRVQISNGIKSSKKSQWFWLAVVILIAMIVCCIFFVYWFQRNRSEDPNDNAGNVNGTPV